MAQSPAKTLEIVPVGGSLRGAVRPPGSKSLTNRALVVAALAEGDSELIDVLDSVDTRVMIESLQRLGVGITQDLERRRLCVAGCAGAPPAAAADLWLENSGTSIRFLTALCALGKGTYRLDGNPRMRQRPIGELLKALQQLGVDAQCELGTDCPPVVIRADGVIGGTATIDTRLSSQYLSALLMAAPCGTGPVEIRLAGELVSEPYVDMTLGVMARFGVAVDTATPGVYRMAPQRYRGTSYEIETDASAASYFFAAAAITQGEVTVLGLSEYALQGDLRFLDVLEQMGCTVRWGGDGVTVQGAPLRGIDIDMNAISDTVQTLAAVAPFATGQTNIRNVGHIRHKETDRIAAVTMELRRLGLQVDEREDGLTIHPGPMHGAVVETYDDHRMAMSFALIGLRQPGIHIADPDCTAKTYPEFFSDLDRLCAPLR
jgi:3-phosphoshikimate 1-carboxyvinyltransferase